MNKEVPDGSTLSHYRIVSKIGAGGMGEVYLAQDTKLDRKVALKILPADVASNRDRMERFVREAKSAAALNHPNIAHIYEIGESDGTHYIAMEFIDGDTLREKIHRDKAPLPKLLKYLIQVAQGLSKAHAAGIVHRDLKPDNIMITRDDYAKVLDFGLAKLVEPQRTFGSNESGSSEIATAVMKQPGWDSGHSTPGMVIGTIGYMSPEQASGRVDEIDLRSDIFSFGCILFEAVTGQRAFAGKDVLDSLHKIVHAPTPQLKDANPLAPAELQRVVRRCLAKEREKRYQSIKELVIELDDLQQELKGFTESKYSGHPAPLTSASTSGMTRGDEGFRIAVLPFKFRDSDPAVEVLADGLSEEIGTGLSRFRYLSVVTNTSAVRPSGEIENEGSLGAKLGTRYVLEGSIRKGGSDIRVSVQLVDTETGAQLWSETYNRDLQTSTIFAVQDDVAGRVVATVADSYGVLVHSMRAAIRKKDDVDLTPVEWQFQYFAYREQITPAAHAALKSRLERAAKSNDRQSALWACLAQIYVDEYAFGFQGDATSLDRALAAGRRAVELDRSNQFALVALAQVHFFRQDLAAFGPAAERAMALNPLNTDALGILGLQIVHTGEFERGTAIVRRAMALNPNHAGWMHFAPLWDHFHKGEYEQALECANRVDVPGLFWPFLVMASACGHLGRRAEAEAAVRDLLALDPKFAAHVRSNVGSWHFASGLMDPLLEGLRKAGLEISNEEPASTPPTPSLASSETRADEGFWVAVLPFKYRGSNPDLENLAEGLSEDIIAGLSRFSSLRVIARSSTLRFSSESADVRSIGRQLGARYVMEGSLRQAGSMLRLVVQLVDASTGAHLWAETYDRAADNEKIFALHDDLVPRIVSSVADWYGALTHSMSEAVRLKPIDQLTPYEAVLRGFGYYERVTPEDHAAVRSRLERAVEELPVNADGWAMLSMMYGEEYRFGFNEQPDSMKRALQAARRAVDAGPSNHFAYLALAQALYFSKEFEAFRNAADRAIALNPMDGSTMEYLGHLIAFSGDWEYGCDLAERAEALNPNHPVWYWSLPFFNAYRNGDYVEARAFAFKFFMPGFYLSYVLLGAVHGQLGERDAAVRAVQDLLTLIPDVSVIKDKLERWYQPELIEKLFDGLSKAGLEISDEKQAAAPTPGPTSASLTASVPPGAARADEGFWVAVLPFKSSGTSSEVRTLAKGLTEEIVTGLSRFSYLRVIARSSTVKYSDESEDVREIGNQLGARYVMEGSIRQAGATIRLAVQLVDATTGVHLWADTYDRQFQPDQVFAVQDELVPRIVSTCADHFGVLARSISDAVRGKEIGKLTPYEALMRGFGYHYRLSSEEHAEARQILEKAVEEAPSNADCWAMLSWTYSHEYGHGFNPQPGPLDRALAAARRAVDLAPSNHLAYQTLAVALFFRKDKAGCLSAAERAMALNPLDASNEAIFLITFLGDWERGCSLIRRAMDLNPYVPGWYRLILALNEYRKANYREALDEAIKANVRGTWADMVLSAIYGQLGEQVVARNSVQNLIAENFAESAREMLGKWFDAELVEHLVDGLRKAGLEITSVHGTTGPLSAGSASGERPALEGFWVAILPFKFTGSNTEVATLAEGLSEEIVTGLSRFSYLRVISRSSTLRYAKETDDVRDVGKTLGARYVMEGSLRIAGSSLRISVQLVDAGTGVHLWAETYDRQFRAEEIFVLQDDLVPRIVSTIADVNGVLPRSMSEVVCAKNPDELSPYEAVLRSFRYFDRVTGEELAAAQSCLEIAVQKAPANADAWAMLALLSAQDYGQGFNLHSDALNSATMAAQRAVEAGPSNHLAHFSLAQARFFQKDTQSFRNAAERAVALNPMDANSLAFIGELLTYVGDSERGLALASRAKQINPNHPGWFWYADFFHAYRQGDYRGALDLILKTNLPGHWGMHAGIAAAAGKLGDHETAAKAVRDLLKLRPDYGATVHNTLAKWFDPVLCEQLLDGLRKAGLEITDEGIGSSGDSTTDSVSPLHPVTPSPAPSPSIAVLPFVNISDDSENEYFCDGLAEELLNALSKIESLHVAARTSAFYFKGKQVDIREIASKLNVSTVLEGSVRKSGNRVRISVQLVNVDDGYHLWSEKYDRELEDIFDIQDEISLAIVDALKLKLRATEQSVVKRHTDNTEAYQLYLKGRFFVNQRTSQSLLKAIDYFNRAIALDANYALGYAGLADAYMVLGVPDAVTEALSPINSLTKARAAAERALEIDPAVGEAYAALAHIKWKERDWVGAESDYQRSIELKPHNPIAHFYYAVYLAGLGRSDEAVKEIRRAQELDPLSLPINASVVYVLYLCRQYDEAIRAGQKTLELDPAFALTHQRLGQPYVAKMMYSEAINQFQEAVNSSKRAPQPLVSLGHAYAVSGNKVEAQNVLDELERLSHQRYVSPYGVATLYVGLGEKKQAFDWLEKAFDENNTELTFLKVDPRLDPLRDDPRFQELLARAGFPQ